MKRILALLLVVLVLLSAGCASLPPPQGRIASVALADTAGTRLGRAIAPQLAANPGQSGVYGLPDGYDAFAARIVLATAAEKSIDAQYFIWHDDQIGRLLFEALRRAAERGVRVRLLLDDGGTAGIDAILAALDAHPHIEVRLYNPFVQRGSRTLGYLSDFTRLNRRMHNKSFTADNQVSVVGGRNIANGYFAADLAFGFADLDVVLIGPVVQQVSQQFDLYWNSASAYAAADFVGTAPADAAAHINLAATQSDPLAVAYLDVVSQSEILRQMLEQDVPMDWSFAQVLYDTPEKTLDRSQRTDVLLLPALVERMGRPTRTFDIISPYFVPGEDGTAMLAELARDGVKVRVLTNSLASSDERIVHAGYMKRRRDLLRAGVALYELKPTANRQETKVRGRFGPAKVAGLHAKTYAVDGERIFVGSFNFDPRSLHLNTELGVVIHNPRATVELSEFFDQDVLQQAYELRLGPDGQALVWIERDALGQETRYDADAESHWANRAAVELLSHLPIDWLL